jgi:hypothetical protein
VRRQYTATAASMVIAALHFGCSEDPVPSEAPGCPATLQQTDYSAAVDSLDASAPQSTTTSTNSTSVYGPDGSLIDGSVVSTTNVQTNAFVPITVTAKFPCPIQGTAHATLVASAGTFTNGLPTATGGSGGGGSEAGAGAGTAGVSGASVNVLLIRGDAGASVTDAGGQNRTLLVGETTLQLPTSRNAVIQVSIGDQASCAMVSVSSPGDAGTAPYSILPCP